MIVVAVAMLGSLTVLPALLSRLGDGVDRLRVPFVGRLRRDNGEGRIWGAIVDRVLRRPLLSAVLAGGLLLALAAPALQLRIATPGPDTFPKSLAVVKTYDRMQQAFPGTALPANVVVKAPDVERAGRPAARSLGSSGGRSRAAALASRSRSTRTATERSRTSPSRSTGTGTDAGVECLPRAAARRDRPGDGRRGPEHRGRRHRADGRMEGPADAAEVEAAAGRRRSCSCSRSC